MSIEEGRKDDTVGEFTAVSLFCGAGGLDYGFHEAGFDTIWACDIDKYACETHRSWSGAKVFCGDLRKVNPSDIPNADILLGGFPCQGFSLAGPRKLDDSRNTLYKEYVRILKEKKPKAFVGENVKGLLTLGKGQVIEAIISDFSEIGYDVHYFLVNAKDYGVPEDRERVIILGFRKDLGIKKIEAPHKCSREVNLRSALANVPPPAESDVCWDSFSSRYMSRNRKREWDQVSYCIPAMAKQVPLHPSSPNMIKNGKDDWSFGFGTTRRLSWQECAAIQTFPSNFPFKGDLRSIYKQIGNAVPCELAKVFGRHIFAILSSHNA